MELPLLCSRPAAAPGFNAPRLDFQLPGRPVVDSGEGQSLGLPHRKSLFVEIETCFRAHGHVAEDADCRRSHQVFDIARRFLAGFDASQEVFPMVADLPSLRRRSSWTWRLRLSLCARLARPGRRAPAAFRRPADSEFDRLYLGAFVGHQPAAAPCHDHHALGSHNGGAASLAEHRSRTALAQFIGHHEVRVLEHGRHRVGGFEIVLHPPPSAEGIDGIRHRLTQALVNRVDVVNTPVGHGPAGIVPEIPECGEGCFGDAPAVLVERHPPSRAQPHIPIEAGRRVAVGRPAETLLL